MDPVISMLSAWTQLSLFSVPARKDSLEMALFALVFLSREALISYTNRGRCKYENIMVLWLAVLLNLRYR